MSKICLVQDCDRVSECRGLCRRHYQAARRAGSLVLDTKGSTRNINGYLFTSGRAHHIAVAEKVMGKALPEGAIVHHVDYNKKNNVNDNLVVCPNVSYHRLIHTRTDAYNACGNASHRKCMLCKQYDDPANMQIHTQSKDTGTTYVHKYCRSIYDKQKRINQSLGN